MSYKNLFINLGNLDLGITTNYINYYQYLKLHFSKAISNTNRNPNIEVEIKWINHPLKLEGDKTYKKIAANTFLADSKVYTTRKIGKRKKVNFLFDLKKNKIKVSAKTQSKPFKDTVRYKIFQQPQESFFFELTYPLIYYPVFWYLEYFNDIHPLHAACVDIKGKAVAVCGLEGTGKTSLSLLLAKELGGKFLSDNITFYDKSSIYPCYEPVRIHKNESISLWKDSFNKINEFRTLKDFYEPIAVNKGAISPYIFIFPVFANEFSINKIPTDMARQKLLNLNQLTQELGNYNEYASLLNLLDLEFNRDNQEQKTLAALLEKVSCYEIAMRKQDGLEANLEKIKDLTLKELE